MFCIQLGTFYVIIQKFQSSFHTDKNTEIINNNLDQSLLPGNKCIGARSHQSTES